MTGKILSGRYEIIKQVGEGGMAHIYLARDNRLKRKVALKVLKSELAVDREVLPRFVREAQSAAKLIHGNIVSVYDIEEDGGLHFIVMEYLEAESLKELIYRKAPLSPETVYAVFRQIADAVAYAHENGIIHRDLKPQNVMVDEKLNVKVTDFGIARAITSSSLTQTGSMMGSVQYFSPEQAQGKPADKTTDVYSLGIILFECLTGKLPFEADNMVAVAFKQVQETPPAPSSINNRLSPEIDRAVLKALRKDPDERYPDVASMLEEVEIALLQKGARREPVMESTLVMKPGQAPVIPPPVSRIDDEGEEDDEDEDEELSSGRNPGANWLYVVLLLIFLSAATYMFVKRGILTPAFNRDLVPDVEGMSLQRARQMADQRGWMIQIAEERYDGKIPEGIIITQEPPVGTKLERGGSIRVVLSRGKPVLQMPDLTGMKLDRAAEELTRSGLKWEVQKSVFSDTVEKDAVISHDPPSGEMVAPGRKVMLVISKGPEKIDIPDLIGKTQEESKKMASARNLSIIVSERVHSDKILEGCIVSQKPEPGASAERGGKIFVVISLGAESLKTPDLVGKTIAQAREDYSSLGLKIAVESGAFDEEIAIESQTPEAGEDLPADKVIKVKLKKQSVVPNLLGRTLEDAQNVVDKSGLSMGAISYKDVTQGQENLVVDQDPKGGIEVDWGGKVNITLSRKASGVDATPAPTAVAPSSTP